tara:strand:- start:372 stop:608 length:237 start_codon:yes stop_codon:yes gene_type:complete
MKNKSFKKNPPWTSTPEVRKYLNENFDSVLKKGRGKSFQLELTPKRDNDSDGVHLDRLSLRFPTKDEAMDFSKGRRKK